MVCVVSLSAQDLHVDGVTGRDGIPKPGAVFTRESLSKMPVTSVRTKDRNGADRVYEGVLLYDLLRSAGQPFGEELRGSLLSRYVIATAKDGYRALFFTGTRSGFPRKSDHRRFSNERTKSSHS